MVYKGGFQTTSNRFKNHSGFIYWGGYITTSIDKIFKKKNLFLKVVYWGSLKTAPIDPFFLICFCTDLILLIHDTKFQTRTEQISIIPTSYIYNTNKVLSKEFSKQWTNKDNITILKISNCLIISVQHFTWT